MFIFRIYPRAAGCMGAYAKRSIDSNGFESQNLEHYSQKQRPLLALLAAKLYRKTPQGHTDQVKEDNSNKIPKNPGRF